MRRIKLRGLALAIWCVGVVVLVAALVSLVADVVASDSPAWRSLALLGWAVALNLLAPHFQRSDAPAPRS